MRLIDTMHYGSKQGDFETLNYTLSHERSERASKRVSGASERANGRASGPVLQSVFLAVIDHSGSEQSDSETSKFPLSHKLGSEQSEQASKRMSAAERASKASRAEQANE